MMRKTLFTLLALRLATMAVAASADDLRALVTSSNYAALRERGESVMPALVRLYAESTDDDQRARVANAFYQLGWKSEAARQALMRDVHTDNTTLRLSVQYALGKVSDDPSVVDTLLANMQDDPNPLFRDKAACALAYDQVHLTEAQKRRLFAGLIHALRDDNPQVRAIAIQALSIHTGQTKGFAPNAPEPARAVAVAEWEGWLRKYELTR